MRDRAVTASLGAYQLGPGQLMTTPALQWQIRFKERGTEDGHLKGNGIKQAHLICALCGQSVCCLGDPTGSYALTAQIIVSGVLAHLKISHEESLPRT